MDLTGRVVLITGARRIGSAVARALAGAGADIAIAYGRSRGPASQTADEVRALGRRALTVQTNVAEPAECAALIDAVDREFGRLDVLVYMASVFEPVAVDALDAAAWDRQVSVDLRGAYLCARAAVPVMRRHGGGRIVTFSDWVAASGRPRYTRYVGYYVAKAGVKALTEALALELAPDDILVNAIAPGPILAPPDLTEEERREVEAATPLGRWGGADEIVKAVRLLVETDFITGETIRVDGGRHLR